MKLTVVWDIGMCSLVEIEDVSEAITGSIIRAMVHWTVSTTLHGETSQQTDISDE
jgi:hypothetical protein